MINHLSSTGITLKIGLDYDNTYTADPECMDKLIRLFSDYGHQVTIVSVRNADAPNEEVHRVAQLHGIDCCFTNGLQKEKCYIADIWIDDDPKRIAI